jgi:hypothetical protein
VWVLERLFYEFLINYKEKAMYVVECWETSSGFAYGTETVWTAKRAAMHHAAMLAQETRGQSYAVRVIIASHPGGDVTRYTMPVTAIARWQAGKRVVAY